jgi:anti-sigma B factor antagonist
LGEGSSMLRHTIRDLIDNGQRKIVLNLYDVDYIDSSGIGELVSGYTTVRNAEGEMKLLHLTKRVHDLLQITRLFTVFDVQSDEESALRSFR